MNRKTKYQSGRPPHDAVNGLRVGALIGGIVGILAVWAFDLGAFWLVILAAVVGGAVGFVTQRRKSVL